MIPDEAISANTDDGTERKKLVAKVSYFLLIPGFFFRS
jgi:hypothetical protein